MSPDVASARPLLDKLGVKPGANVAVVDLDDPGFMKLLRERTSDIVQGKPRTPCDIVFLGATAMHDLQRLTDIKSWIEPNGAIWVVRAKGPRAPDDRFAGRVRRKRPEGAAPIALQPRGAESIGGLPQGVLFHEARLERDRDRLDNATRPQFWAAGILEHLRDRRRAATRSRATAADLGEQGLDAIRLALDGAQHVETDDVPRALPNSVQRRLAVQACERGVLHVTVAPEALHCLHDDRGEAFAQPVLRDGCHQAHQEPFALVTLRTVEGSRKAKRQQRRGLGL